MYCTNCGNKTNSKHCPKCGHKRYKEMKYCPWCGAELNEGADICTNCKEKIKPGILGIVISLLFFAIINVYTVSLIVFHYYLFGVIMFLMSCLCLPFVGFTVKRLTIGRKWMRIVFYILRIALIIFAFLQVALRATPVNTTTTDSGYDQSNDYDQLKQLVMDGNYQEAAGLYMNSNLANESEQYPDAEEYYWYAKGMTYYQASYYGDAYEILDGDCKGFLEADSVVQEIEDSYGMLNGVYENTSVNYDGMYLFIKDGKVGTDIVTDGIPSSAHYFDSLCEYQFDDGSTSLAVGFSLTEKVEYVFNSYTADEIVMIALEGNDTTFSGVYKRVSNDVPEDVSEG